jgi:DNA modification methylase
VVRETLIDSNNTQLTLEGKKIPEDWDFAKADTSYLTHGLHEYPARMIPQIARRLIVRYTKEKDMILDPFCGSGTTLVEARLANRNAIGNDINPFACLLAKVKSSPLDFEKMRFDPNQFNSCMKEDYAKMKSSGKVPDLPLQIMPNLLHWFKEQVALDLEFIWEYIQRIDDQDLQDFLKIVFSDTIFKTSNIDHRSSRFIRILHEKELAKFQPDVFGYFHTKLLDSVTRMIQYNRKLKELNADKSLSIAIYKGDARCLPFSEIDAAITSPPYGEEKNTVGYARWAKLSSAWLGLDKETLKQAEKCSLGAISEKNIFENLEKLESPTAVELLSNLLKNDPGRVKDALPFFFDYLKTFKEVYKVLKPASYYCVVIGDRSIRQNLLDMEKVSVELGKAVGFNHIRSFFRQIPMKLIPWKTPTGKTISRESIIILKKG